MDGCSRFNGLRIHAPLLYQLHTRESAAIDRLIKFKINYFKTHAAFFHKRWKQRPFQITIYTIKEWWQQNEQARSLNKIYNHKCKFNYILLKTTHLTFYFRKARDRCCQEVSFFKLFCILRYIWYHMLQYYVLLKCNRRHHCFLFNLFRWKILCFRAG